MIDALRELEEAWLKTDQPVPFEYVEVVYRTGDGRDRVRGADLYRAQRGRTSTG